MRTWQKALLVACLAPIVVVGGYAAYLAATYIDDTATSGAAYGFAVGSSKAQAVAAILQHQDSHPNIATYVSYGPRAGDHFTLDASDTNLARLGPYDQWDVLLDGQGEFFNTVKLTFHNERLVRIHRHRRHFELP